MDLKYMIPQTFISLVIINYGIIVRLNKENQPLSELLKQNLISIINGFILGFLSLVLFRLVLLSVFFFSRYSNICFYIHIKIKNKDDFSQNITYDPSEGKVLVNKKKLKEIVCLCGY